METIEQRKRRVNWAVSLTKNTTITPGEYEQRLLDHYVNGVLTIDQVITLLDEQQKKQGA